MLKTDAVERVVEFDVHAKVIAVELELVAGTQARVFIEISTQGRNRAIEAQLPVAIPV